MISNNDRLLAEEQRKTTNLLSENNAGSKLSGLVNQVDTLFDGMKGDIKEALFLEKQILTLEEIEKQEEKHRTLDEEYLGLKTQALINMVVIKDLIEQNKNMGEFLNFIQNKNEEVSSVSNDAEIQEKINKRKQIAQL